MNVKFFIRHSWGFLLNLYRNLILLKLEEKYLAKVHGRKQFSALTVIRRKYAQIISITFMENQNVMLVLSNGYMGYIN